MIDDNLGTGLIDMTVVTDGRLKHMTRLLYAYLTNFRDVYQPKPVVMTQRQMADKLGISLSTVHAAIANGEDVDMWTVTRRPRETDSYELHDFRVGIPDPDDVREHMNRPREVEIYE